MYCGLSSPQNTYALRLGERNQTTTRVLRTGDVLRTVQSAEYALRLGEGSEPTAQVLRTRQSAVHRAAGSSAAIHGMQFAFVVQRFDDQV